MPAKKPPDSFSSRLRKAMDARDMKARRLAEATGVSEPTISQLLSGQRGPSLTVAGRLADALGVSVDSLRPKK